MPLVLNVTFESKSWSLIPWKKISRCLLAFYLKQRCDFPNFKPIWMIPTIWSNFLEIHLWSCSCESLGNFDKPLYICRGATIQQTSSIDVKFKTTLSWKFSLFTVTFIINLLLLRVAKAHIIKLMFLCVNFILR